MTSKEFEKLSAEEQQSYLDACKKEWLATRNS